MTTYEPHPAAMLFDPLPEDELAALAEDIQKNGQHHPAIITRAGLLLDGRNRQEACKRLGTDLKVVTWSGAEDVDSPTAYVLSVNQHRRHLNPTQRAIAAARSLPLFKAEAKARQRDHGGTAPGRKSEITVRPAADSVPPAPATKRKPAQTAAAMAASAAGASPRSVERAAAVLAEASPDEIAEMRAGKKSLTQVEKKIKKAKQVAQIRVYRPPQGEYAVISADPPWQYDDQLDGSDAVRGACPYPTMPLEAICALRPPAAKDCVLWLWTTNAFLADGSAARVVKSWGFESKTILTWIKPKMGNGWWLRNITEHCILAVRGNPKVDLSNQTTELRAALGEHSAKPEAFYALVEQLCPSPSRIEMFAREPRKGWATTGAELPKEPRAVDVDKDVEDNICGGSNCTGCADHPKGRDPAPPPPPKKKRLVIQDRPGVT